MAKQFGLGKGLSAFLPKNDAQIHNEYQHPVFVSQSNNLSILEIDPIKIRANPYQPRKQFQENDLSELVESIRIHGILQPLIVTRDNDEYELIAGERRLRAAKILHLPTVPVILRSVQEQQKLEFALIENVQRKDLNALEEALAYQELIDNFNLTQEDVGKRVGKNRTTITNTLRLLSLPEKIQDALMEERITAGHARSIASLKTFDQQMDLFQKITSEKFNVRDAEEYVQSYHRSKRNQNETVDPNIRESERRLEEKLSTRVKIQKRGKHGKILIEFYSDEELGNILKELFS